MNPLMALSPLDGRYADKLTDLRPIFSEFGLIYYRLLVEIDWLKYLAQSSAIPEVPSLSAEALLFLDNILVHFNLTEAESVKTIEAKTNHDVKAIEYYLQKKFADHPELASYIPFLHFACTSEDINNLSYALMLSRARTDVCLPVMDSFIELLRQFAHQHAEEPMLARTHGQAATTTTVGKEMANFVARLQKQRNQFAHIALYGKFNGATGSFNAHAVAYPEIEWPEMMERFVESLGLPFNTYTTQIEPHDGIAELLNSLAHFNTILLDFCRDCWTYISQDYFTQQIKSEEIGSSTMPHKVNPIDFENAEGNIGLANALCQHMASKLPVSRLQRDLSDSTVLRNLGIVLGYSLLAWQSAEKGLQKIRPNPTQLQNDLNQHWEIITEAIQTVLRQHGIPDAYEQLKQLSRGKKITVQDLKTFIEQLPLPQASKKQLLELTPSRYIGFAARLARQI